MWTLPESRCSAHDLFEGQDYEPMDWWANTDGTHRHSKKISRQTAQPENGAGHTAVWLTDSVATDASVPF